ncbi:SRPBCC family protein [Gemella cuniculi]|uniref:SRPBCC family protein n=1 Tax=Gemella cuniculi TaxID=150240 RepID=UPI00041F8246|nr:SRPBCC family protein [Gemella cuniculi]
MIERVEITQEIKAPTPQVFSWFFKSENFIKSPIVFKADWRKKSSKWIKGSQRDIIMIAGWYFEEITDVKKDIYIRYKVNRSFPTVRQDFTEIAFKKIDEKTTKVTWIIEIEVPTPVGKKLANRLAGKMAKTLYKTILTAGKKELEKSMEE